MTGSMSNAMTIAQMIIPNENARATYDGKRSNDQTMLCSRLDHVFHLWTIVYTTSIHTEIFLGPGIAMENAKQSDQLATLCKCTLDSIATASKACPL